MAGVPSRQHLGLLLDPLVSAPIWIAMAILMPSMLTRATAQATSVALAARRGA